ncbi:hypothetical protein F4823DRAFT_636996 [Ustulina deusta]|nr:hypothetical protein F4823DRAFT_636996 [Ustulina deusta]
MSTSPNVMDLIQANSANKRSDTSHSTGKHESQERSIDPASTSSTTEKKYFAFWMSLLFPLTSVIISLDATSLAVAVPTIIEELHGTTLESFWASITFILGVAVTQPIYVSLSGVLGRKLPLYGSMGLVAIGTVAFTASHHMSVPTVP